MNQGSLNGELDRKRYIVQGGAQTANERGWRMLVFREELEAVARGGQETVLN
jgi:hypothetical protein